MAPPKKPFEAASAKAYAGAQGIKQFFAVIQPKKKAGRPPKKRKKNGVIAANTSANATRDSPPMVNVLTSTPTVNGMVNALTSPSALEKEMATNIIKYESFVRNLETVPASEGTVIVCGDSCAESEDA